MRCWYTRWQMSSALDRGELAPRMARGHAATCASCQAFGRALASLHDQLARDAHTAVAPAPAPVPAVRRPRTRWLVAGPLAAGAAAAIALSLNPGPEPPAPGPPLAVQVPMTLDGMRGIADGVTQVLTRSPLETELANLIQDSKRGLDEVLAAGGLPAPR